MNILKQHTKIEDYCILDKLGNAEKPYRQLYIAQNSFGKYYILTVYDVDVTPKSLKSGKNGVTCINEFELRSKLTKANEFPRLSNMGTAQIDGKNIAWLCSDFCEFEPLSNYIKAHGAIEAKQAVEMIHDVLLSIHEVSLITDGGGHFNLSLDNLMVYNDKDGKPTLMLIGWSHLSMPCNGRPVFDTKELDPLYRAPETFLGQFTKQSDIYSLGITLAYMLIGHYPWDASGLNMADKVSVPTKIKAMMKEPISIPNVDSSILEIVRSATAMSLLKRLKSAKDLLQKLEFCVGIDEHIQQKSSSVLIDKTDSKDEADKTNEMMGRPSSTISIGKVNGNGYADVAGMEALKTVFRRNFIDIVKNIELAKQFQITPPNSSLLYGPPGAGKTFIVQKTAEEAGLNYTLIKPSDIASVYIHGSQSMIADVFKKAEKMAPVLLCFDEFDAMVPARTADDKNNTGGEVNEFLAQLNNCAERGIYVMGTTNRPDRIDKAILRKGRFDELIYVPLPDFGARKSMFEIELDKRPHDETINSERLATLTESYSSSDIAYIVKEAARTSFDRSIHSASMAIKPIDESLLESLISQTKPSVSKEELKRYEQMEKEMSQKKDDSRPRIGFIN